MQTINRLIALSACTLGLTQAANSQTPQYQVEYLGNAKVVNAINGSGLCVGTGTLGLYSRAYVAGPGKPITYLPIPFGFLSSGATDINDLGVIVGVISPNTTTGFYPQPAKWTPNGSGGYAVTLLATLPGDNRGTADAINNLGDIVGTSNYQSNLHTVLYTDTGPVELPGLAQIPARAVNDARQYVGGNNGAFRVSLNTLQAVALPGPFGSSGVQAWEINRAGQVAGDFNLGGCSQAALREDQFGWQAVGACGSGNSSYDLNDTGDLLYTESGVPTVHLMATGTFAVADLIPPSAGAWTVDATFDMGSGRVVRSRSTAPRAPSRASCS